MNNEKHHPIPVSLWGPNNPDLLMSLSSKNHREVLHATLDIPMQRYKSYTRLYKERYWDKIILPPDWVEMIWEMQREFLHKLNKLPWRMQQEHVKYMMSLSSMEREKYIQLTWQPFDKPKNAPSACEKVHNLHTNYIDCRKEISKEIVNIIKLKMKK